MVKSFQSCFREISRRFMGFQGRKLQDISVEFTALQERFRDDAKGFQSDSRRFSGFQRGFRKFQEVSGTLRGFYIGSKAVQDISGR